MVTPSPKLLAVSQTLVAGTVLLSTVLGIINLLCCDRNAHKLVYSALENGMIWRRVTIYPIGPWWFAALIALMVGAMCLLIYDACLADYKHKQALTSLHEQSKQRAGEYHIL